MMCSSFPRSLMRINQDCRRCGGRNAVCFNAVRPDWWRIRWRSRSRRSSGRWPGRRPAAQRIFPTCRRRSSLPTLSAEVTGPGPMFDSAPSLAPGKGLAAFSYEAHEYFVSGTANGEPYTTRIVVRKPADNVEVQRPRARRSDARQRRRAHVRVHVDLHDVVGPRRGRDPDDAAGAVRRAQRGALQAT